MLCDQVAAISDNLIGILHDLQLLVAIVPMQSHAFADHFQDIEDAERPIPLMRAQLAMIGMIDRNQGIDTGITCRLELPELQFALESRKNSDVDALQAYRRLLQINQFDTRDHLQDL